MVTESPTNEPVVTGCTADRYLRKAGTFNWATRQQAEICSSVEILRMYVRGSSRVCAHAIAVQNVFTVVLRVAEKHFIADATIPDLSLIHI